jgi:hypothetical protein
VERKTRWIFTVVLVVGVLVTLIALDLMLTGGEALAGQYGRHGSS